MKKIIIGLVFIFLGVILIALSGLEKVLVSIANSNGTINIDAIINSTPSYIWNITNYTFGFGLAILIIGLCFVVDNWIKKQFNINKVEG